MKKHLITCAVVLGLIAVTFFIVFTFENMVFALARVQFLPASSSYRGDSVGRQSQRVDLDRAALEERSQKADLISPADTNETSASAAAVAELAAAASH
jgi:hypothetical protein